MSFTEKGLRGISPDILKLNPELSQLESATTEGSEPSKYRNVRQVVDGETFGSGKEAADAGNFRLAVRAGKYIAYLHHVRLPLLDDGTYYEADHVLICNDLSVQVFDSKAMDEKTLKFRFTKEFILKRKMFRQKYGRDIEVI